MSAAGDAARAPVRIWTIGHSTRTLDQFVRLLRAHGITTVVDVRRFPGSRRHPHFSRDLMGAALATVNIDYVSAPELGGFRRPRPDSPHAGWRHPSFRGYADYMDTPEFAAAIEVLEARARRGRLVVMCAEASWRQCHRGLIADWLKARGADVDHIVDERRTEPHPFTDPAVVIDGRVTYPGGLPFDTR